MTGQGQPSPAFPVAPSACNVVVPGLRWWIVSLIFLATVINIVDRLSVSVLAPVIREQLHLTNFAYAQVSTWFLLAYTISQGVSGFGHDRIGAKRGLAASITLWSTAAALHSLARGFLSLCSFRVLLGIGEGGNWPGALKVITDWFPSRERALALGMMNAGSSMGAIVAPPVIVWLQLTFGWQTVFLVTGALGFLWLIAWLFLYQDCDHHPWLSPQEHQLIRANQTSPSVPGSTGPRPPPEAWWHLLRFRQVWAMVLSRFLVDPIWWLYILWLPAYLSKAHGISLKDIGVLASLPFIAAGIGGLVGGGFSGFLIRRGWTINAARKTAILLFTGLMPAGILAAQAHTTLDALLWISVVTFGFQAWINNVQILPSDLFPAARVASIGGLGGVGAGMGSMLFTLTTGWVVDHFSYVPILLTAGLLSPLGTLVLFSLIGRIEPIPHDQF